MKVFANTLLVSLCDIEVSAHSHWVKCSQESNVRPGAHPLEKFDSKVEKIAKIAIFTPLLDFFFCIIYWYGLLKIISHKCLELWKKLNWAADKVYGDQKFGFHFVFSVHSQKYEFFRSVPFWIFLIPKSFSDFKNQFSSPKKPN